MSNVVNLNKFRKKRARKTRQSEAERNRIEHGRTKAEKDAAKAENERNSQAHDNKKLETGDTEPDDQ